jgi:hypothetical protein
MLVHITNQLTDWRYLVDTSASFSLVPHRSKDPPATKPRLTGPNGLPIQCRGEEKRRLRFGGRTFEWSFLQADVSFAILGVDFLHANKLLVDVSANSLVNSSTGDRFHPTGQPSGHKAFIILPANMAAGAPEPAPRGAASSTTGRASYAAVAAAPATWSFAPAAPQAARAAGPMPTNVPAILDLFQDVLHPGRSYRRHHAR